MEREITTSMYMLVKKHESGSETTLQINKKTWMGKDSYECFEYTSLNCWGDNSYTFCRREIKVKYKVKELLKQIESKSIKSLDDFDKIAYSKKIN